LLAEFERELIRARTGEGRSRAKARGVKMGRPPKMTAHQVKEALSRRDAGDAGSSSNSEPSPIDLSCDAVIADEESQAACASLQKDSQPRRVPIPQGIAPPPKQKGEALSDPPFLLNSEPQAYLLETISRST